MTVELTLRQRPVTPQARDEKMRFDFKKQTDPDADVLILPSSADEGFTPSAGHAPSLEAVQTIHDEAPIGAVAAHIVIDDYTGQPRFGWYTDHNERRVSHGSDDLLADALDAATYDGLRDIDSDDLTEYDVDGEAHFLITLES